MMPVTYWYLVPVVCSPTGVIDIFLVGVGELFVRSILSKDRPPPKTKLEHTHVQVPGTCAERHFLDTCDRLFWVLLMGFTQKSDLIIKP